MCKLDLEKAEEPEIKLPTPSGSSKKQESSRKTSIFALLRGQEIGLKRREKEVQEIVSYKKTDLRLPDDLVVKNLHFQRSKAWV